MTLPADTNSDTDPNSGKALAPASSSPINPFLASAASSETPVAPRSFMSRLLDYSAHAAIIVGLIGFAWTVSSHMSGHSATSGATPAPVAAVAIPEQPMDEMAQMRLTNQKMHDEIKVLRASVESLRMTVRHDTTPEQVRVLSAGLDSIKGSIGTNTSAIAQLNGKVEKLQPGKLQQLTERVGRLEHQTLDPAATGSIAKADVAKSENTPKPPVKPASLVSEDMPGSETEKPQVITGWVVRDVYQGVALIEGKRGSMEVVPGVAIPGAGTVKSIERHGSGWTVMTTKGQLAFAASPAQRDYRRSPYQQRGGYPPYRYDY